MSDSFGRHKSTRWANASVPSYGEEWDGDDYDYDYGSNDDKSHSSEPAVDAQDPSPNSDLVLSIDQIHREEDSDLGSDSDVSLETPKLSLTSLPRGSDSDFDFHGKPSVAPIDTSRNPEKTETEKIVHGEDDIPAQHVVSTRAIDDVMVPPTPTFSTHKEPDTPRSESSFQSDADSIQYEPKDLNIRGPEKEIDVTGDAYENEHQSQSSTESAAQDSALSSSQTESEHLVLSSPVTAAHTEPLVLTIDREQSSTDSDTSTIEDVDERNTHDQRSSRDISEDDDNPLDSLIYDLQSATTNDKGHLPTLDSLQDIKLPDFENTSFGHLKEYEVESPSTPTAPLDMSRSHQEYVKAQTPRKSSVRKAPRTELMSVDYSNIADAVSGYMSDGRPESLRKELFVNPIVEDDSSPEADEEHDQSDLESRDLHPVVSSGSLSTGKLSLASSIQPSKNESKEDVSRRVSTSTINMGGWKPNTNNYRDQFINDIDNESVVNFNAQGNDGYRQFTNLRNSLGGSGFDSVAETQSNASSLSIPETIDAALPSIQEDDDHDSSFGKSTEEAAPEESSTFESHSTFDTVFKPHDHVQNFKELLTPTSSSAELPREKQRYSSLLGDSSTLDDASTRKPSTEIVDSESDATVAAVGSPVSEPSTVIRKKSLQKPLYNWNNIISKSQPIDRIALFKEALKKENEYDSGLREWLQEALKQVENSPNMHIGKIASQAYQNAPHNELRRHTSLRSKVSSVRDKVETSGLQASTLGKRFLNRDLFTFWLRSMYGFYHREDPLKDLLDEIKNVQTYSEWKNKVMKIDKLTNMDLWRQDLISKHYDYILVNERLKLLRAARFDQDSQLIMSLLRSGLVRNFGGIAQKRLFTKAYLGTKHNIEEYIEEVLECLNYLNESINTPSDRENVEYIMNSKQLKLDFFHDVRQSFGCTALVLQGGSLFGLCHLGVVKALYFKGLLPRIIGGSAVGAAVASLVCTLTDEELIPILISIQDAMGDVDRLNHDVDERYGNVIENVVKKGYSQDILVFLKFVRDTIGDLTFEEAYLKTEKVLNIVVHPSHSSVPSLLNYITSPNVIIWTAIYASIGTGVLSDNVQLYVKDFNNNIVPKEPNIPIKFMKPQDVSYSQQYFRGFKKNDHSDMERSDGSRQNLKVESPYTRLTELFNVNHFINSLARPYLAPLISNDLKHYHSYGKVRYNFKSLEVDTNNDDEADVTFGYLMDEPQQSKSFVIDKRKSFLADPESYTKDTSINLFKNLKNILGLELQHRLEVMNKLGILSDVIKRFCIDEKPAVAPSLAGIREVSIVPELRYLLRDFGRVFDVHKTMENIPYWVLVGERSVWPLFPLLWVRCSIEFTLDDLYNLHRKK